jgi:hypothetical protein
MILYDLINLLYENKKINNNVRMLVYFTLMTYYGTKITATNEAIANKLSISIDQTNRCLKWLKNANLIGIVKIGNNFREIVIYSKPDKAIPQKNLENLKFDWLNDSE